MRRYDPAPFFARLSALGMSQSELSRRLGCDPSTVAKWLTKGVGENFVDQAAVAVGLVPANLWPEWIDDEIERVERDDRAAATAAKRRWRAKRTDEQRQAEADYLAAYRAQYREHLNAQRRARYRNNPQAEIDYASARKRRLREERAS